MRNVMLAALLLLISMGAVAAERTASLQVMVEQQQALREDLARGLHEVTPRQTRIIKKSQEQFFTIAEGKTTLDQLTIEEKVLIENALESINAQLVNTNAATGNQEVCWREKKTGSNMEVTRCGTQQEIDDARDNARGYLLKPKICVPPGCGV